MLLQPGAIPCQHEDWIAAQPNMYPFRPPSPEDLQVFRMCVEPENQVSFVNLATSSEIRSALFQTRKNLATSVQLEYRQNPLMAVNQIMDYLKLLPLSTQTHIGYFWQHYQGTPQRCTAQHERLYLTYTMGCLYLHANHLNPKSDYLVSALKAFKFMPQFIAANRKSFVDDRVDEQDMNELELMGKYMTQLCWLLVAHEGIEKKIIDFPGRTQSPQPFHLNMLSAMCYYALSVRWQSLCSSDESATSASGSKIVVTAVSTTPLLLPSKLHGIEYYASIMHLGCRSVSEFFALRCIILNPSRGREFYTAMPLNMYRGVAISRLQGYTTLIQAKLAKPDLLDKFKLSAHSAITQQVYAAVTDQIIDKCFQPLLTHLQQYNRQTSLDPVPPFSLTDGDITYAMELKPLPVPSVDTFAALEYPIPETVVSSAVLLAESPAAPTLFSPLLNRLSLFGLRSATLGPIVQAELNRVQVVKSSSTTWANIRMKLADIITYRLEHLDRIPLEAQSYCELTERSLLYQLENQSTMPAPVFNMIEHWITTEIQPFYEAL